MQGSSGAAGVPGQWGDAVGYLRRFNSRKSVASNALHFFLYTLWALANVAASERNGSVKSTAHHHALILSSVLCRRAKLCSIIKGMLASPGQWYSIPLLSPPLYQIVHIIVSKSLHFCNEVEPT